MKVGILTFEQFQKTQNIGSSRIRGHWLAKHWPEAEIYKMGQAYDVMIYQKVYWIEHAEKFKGIKILDMCDPDFLHWGYRVKQMIDLCDAVTTSTEELAKYLTQLTDKPVWCIPDRLDMDLYKDIELKKHVGPTETLAWFGYSSNFEMLDAAVPAIIKAGIKELIVIADRKSPYKFKMGFDSSDLTLTNLPWTAETVHTDLQKADAVINPKGSKGRWKYKSNNKTITAWRLGLPVAHNDIELKKLMTAEERQAEADLRLAEVKRDYDITKSIRELQDLIAIAEQERNKVHA